MRAVLTDHDFHYNVFEGQTVRNQGVYAQMVLRASKVAPFVAMLNGATPAEPWVGEIAGTGARTVPVASMAEFPRVSAALAEGLFGRPPGSAPQGRPGKQPRRRK